MNQRSDSPGGSRFSMADISAKAPTARRALARGRIVLGAEALGAVARGEVPKGDPLTMAEIAGIQGAKRTPSLLPLCHPIALNRVGIHFRLDEELHSVWVYCIAEIYERTGVEMEALTGVNVALLTLWDLCKPLNPDLEINQVALLAKSGGKHGDWKSSNGLDETARELLREYGTSD